MSQTGVVAWSQTAASNGTSDSAVNFAEGQSPASLNDSARALMASGAKYRDDTAGSLATAGTSTAYTLATNQVFSALTVLNGQELSVTFHTTNGTSPTLNVDGLGAKAINVDTATAVGTGVIKANSVWELKYDNSNSCFILKNVPAAIQDGTVATASIAANAVTLPKLATQADGTIVGNISGGVAAPVALTISGAAKSGTTITVPHPPAAAFSNLSVKVTGNTGVTLAADWITVTDGSGNWQTLAFNQAINMASTGAGALDTGSIASATWYAVWAIAKADGTTSAIASTSTTAPTMPAGYTYKARVARVRTSSSSAQLMGTWQFGRRATYIVGLAQTSGYQVAGSGTSVALYTAISVSSFVPTDTAPNVIGFLYVGNGAGAWGAVATNSSSFNTNLLPGSPGPVPPVIGNVNNNGGSAGATTLFNLPLESSNLYWGTSSNGSSVQIMGWEDNL